MMGALACLLAAGDLGAESPATTTEPSARRATWPQLVSGPLQDNSFLIEEAYNQEEGVVQHILSAERDQKTGVWTATFTQEWPLFSIRHQLSYTVPYEWEDGRDGATGVGDVLLNYRYQLLLEEARRPAVAPRLSLILPTGSVDEGLGNGSAGLQVNVPVSKQLNQHFAAHLNLGTTLIPDAHAPTGPPRREFLDAWQGGGSVIWEPADAINLLCELLASRDAEVGDRGVDHPTRVTLNPGIRMAWNGPLGTQWVGGAAVPIGLTRETDDLGVFLYFSLEHAFTAAAQRERWD